MRGKLGSGLRKCGGFFEESWPAIKRKIRKERGCGVKEESSLLYLDLLNAKHIPTR